MVHRVVTRPHRRVRGEDGVVIPLVAMFMMAIVAMAAIVLDLGEERQLSRKLQSTADAAALAGAADLPVGAADPTKAATAVATANVYASSNLGGASATITVTTPYTLAGSTYPSHQLIRVGVCKKSVTILGPVVGGKEQTVCRSAVAYAVNEVLMGPPAVLALDPHACYGMKVEGSGKIVGSGGSVYVDSDCTSGTKALAQEGATATITATSGCVCAVGGASLQHPSNLAPTVLTGQTAVPDPYAGVQNPAYSSGAGCDVMTTVCGIYGGSYHPSGSYTFTPGRYTSTLTIDKPGTYVFAPGVYEFQGGMKVEGAGADLVADDVLWWVSGGQINFGSGPDNIRVSALDTYATGQFKGIAILYTSTSKMLWGDDVRAGVKSGGSCSVTSTSGIVGGIYVPNAQLEVRGNTSTVCTEGAPIIAKTLHVLETGFLQGSADGSMPGVQKQVVKLVD